MKRPLLLGLAMTGLLFASSSDAAAQPSQQQAAPVSVAVQGQDSERGPFKGQLTLTPLDDGQVRLERQVTYADGGSTTQAGVGRIEDDVLKASLQAPDGGLSGGLVPTAPLTEPVQVQLQVDAQAGEVQSEGRGAGRRFLERGKDAGRRVVAFFRAMKERVADSAIVRGTRGALGRMGQRIRSFFGNVRDRLRARRANDAAPAQAEPVSQAPASQVAAPAVQLPSLGQSAPLTAPAAKRLPLEQSAAPAQQAAQEEEPGRIRRGWAKIKAKTRAFWSRLRARFSRSE